MQLKDITEMLRREARNLDDAAGIYTQEAIVMREAAAKLDELQSRKARGEGKYVRQSKNCRV